jgi:hypothetical protein
MKDAGMIIDSKSPWCSPVRLVKKPDGSIRICIDFRKVNNCTIKDSFPLPKIDDLFTHLAKAKVFSTFDLAHGYHQVRMDKNSRQYTAFSTQWGFYEYVVMPFGLTNSCATFQRLMVRVLEGLLGVSCLVYLDDVICFSETLEQHKIDVENILKRFRQYNLKIKPSKCKFARTKIEYLSHIIENGTIRPNPAKASAVSESKRPRTVKQVQAFLGLVSYYRKFIKNCSSIASPLIKLTEKKAIFKWTENCEQSFQTLKNYLVSENVLALPDFSKEFVVEADASQIGVGAVLSQKIDRHYRPIAYFSKHLNKTEQNYSTSERELLAIVLAVEHFKEYLYGREFKILSDHEPLKFLATSKCLYAYNRIQSWKTSWKRHDSLSRMVDEAHHENDKTLQADEVVINVINFKPKVNENKQTLDPKLKWIVNLIKSNKTRPNINEFENAECKSLYTQWKRLKIIDNVLYREYMDQYDRIMYQYVVPHHEREFILKNSHDTLFCGHFGFQKTHDRIIHKYYWYKQADDIKRYCQECTNCQRYKTSNKYNKAKLKPYIASRPNQIVSADVFGPIPTTINDNKYILVVSELFTKYVEFFALKTQTAEETANKLIEYVSRHSVMDTILTDQGRNFQSELMDELWELFDVHKVRTTPYFPSANGQCERMMRSMQNMLANYCNEQKNNWDKHLALLQLAYNSAVHTSHNFTPFELEHGRLPRIPLDLLSQRSRLELEYTPDSYATQLQNELPLIYEQVRKNIKISVNRNKIRHDRQCRAANFIAGDYVWCLDTAKLKGVSKKLSARWKGPYVIKEVIDDANYKLKMVNGKKVLVVNKSKLKRCYERKILTDLAKDNVDETLFEEKSDNETTQSNENIVKRAGKKRGPKPKQHPPKSSKKPKRKKRTSAQRTTNTSKQASDTIQAQNSLSSSDEHNTPNKTIVTNEKTIEYTPHPDQSKNASCPNANQNNQSITDQNENNSSRPKRIQRPPDRYQA